MIIRNGNIFRPDGRFRKGGLFMIGGRITGDSAGTEGPVLDAEGLYVIPALTDIHLHGAAGADFSEGTEEAIRRIAGYELSRGVMHICPAAMTLPEDALAGICRTAAGHEGSEGAELCGIRLEGPFLSPEKRGAQDASRMRLPDREMFARLQEAAAGRIRILDLAPELPGAMEFIRACGESVRISLGHTAADYGTAMEAFAAGARQVTHLFNAMPPLAHREPGLIGAAADSADVMAELICDGVHIHPSAVRAAFRLFGDDRIIMISDSMEACGMGDGAFRLGGKDVTVRGNRAILADGTLAGSVTDLMGCLRIAVRDMGIPLESAVKCAAVNPARALGITDRCGSLAPGMAADAVLLGPDLSIRGMVRNGQMIPPIR